MIKTSPNDIVVTTPISKSDLAAREAQECIDAGGGSYFRVFHTKPKSLVEGSRMFYVDRGYIRGFGTVSRITYGNKECRTSGVRWGEGFYAHIPASSWQWIAPIYMKGFQGFRYFGDKDVVIIGGWLDPMPERVE